MVRSFPEVVEFTRILFEVVELSVPVPVINASLNRPSKSMVP